MTRNESYDTDLKVIQKNRKISGVDPYKLVLENDSTLLSRSDITLHQTPTIFISQTTIQVSYTIKLKVGTKS